MKVGEIRIQVIVVSQVRVDDSILGIFVFFFCNYFVIIGEKSF